jgi:hypothetical protein
MALQLDCASAPVVGESDDWSVQYAIALKDELAELAPDLAVSVQSDAIGITISGTGWAIHAVRSEPDGERYLSLMAMRGMHNSSCERAIRDLCMAMDADLRHQRADYVIGE